MNENTDVKKSPKREGAFVESLKRNNKQIRDDRATAIAEDTQMVYRRRVEDLDINIRRLERQLEAMLDLSPTNTIALVPNINDFDPSVYVNKELELGLKIRNERIKLEIAKNRYEYLFGGN